MPDRDEDQTGSSSMDGDSFVALKNAEGQFSLWPSGRPAPDGWQVMNAPGSKADCVAFIEAHWTDMRPESLRGQMEGDLKR